MKEEKRGGKRQERGGRVKLEGGSILVSNIIISAITVKPLQYLALLPKCHFKEINSARALKDVEHWCAPDDVEQKRARLFTWLRYSRTHFDKGINH